MKDYKVLLEKFWNGTASDMEKLQLYKIVSEEEDTIRQTLQQEFEPEGSKDLTPGASQAILDSLHREIGARASRSIEMPQSSPWRLFRWAAALLVVGLAFFFGWQLYTATGTDKVDGSVAVSFEVISNEGTGIKEFVLSDGSGIRLYPHSSIRFVKPFHTQTARSISLSGKADFKVKHNAAQPFEVIAYHIKTTDIGTEFSIDAPDEHSFRLALREGSVRVGAMPNSGLDMPDMILQPGDEAHWDDSGKKMRLAKVITQQQAQLQEQNTTSPAKAKLTFDKTPLAQVFAGLEAREGMTITFKKEELKELTFTGTIEPTDNIETALSIICNLNGLNYRKTKQAFTVVKNK